MSSSREITLPPMFDDLEVGITLHDPETGEVLDINERLEKLYGYSREQLRGMSVEEYTAPSTKYTEERAVRQIRDAADGNSYEFDWQIERSNGELRWVSVSLSASTIDGVDCVIAEIHDITESRAREQRLRLLSRILRHNLRNKMTVVTGRAGQIRSLTDDDGIDHDAEQILETAREVGSLSESVRQIEEIAEPDATERTVTSIESIVQPIVAKARETYPAAKLTLEIEASVEIIADDGVRYAVEHAIENAVEHNDNDEPAVTVTVTEDTDTDQGVIRITDDGPPIPTVETNVLNEAVETSSTYHGSGVGLWVMQWCIDSLGGTLSFETATPRGNTISITLPKKDDCEGR